MDWDTIKATFQLILVPLLGIFGYHYKRRLDQIDNFNSELTSMKVKAATVETQLISIDDQLKEVKSLINILISKLENKRR